MISIVERNTTRLSTIFYFLFFIFGRTEKKKSPNRNDKWWGLYMYVTYIRCMYIQRKREKTKKLWGK